MSSLTIALACAGGLVLAGVVAHGAWQARKAGPKRAEAPRGEPREPTMDMASSAAERIDPVMQDATDGEPVVAAAAPLAEAPLSVVSLPATPRKATARLDALIDAIATLRLDAPVSGDLVISHLPTTRRAGGKPFLIEGLNAETGEWEAPVAGQRYGELQAGVQLANRAGPMNDIEYSEFVQKIVPFAEGVGAMADFPDMLDAANRARELDQFAGDHDAQLAVHLQARGAAWSVGYIQQHGARHGFVAGMVPGRLVLPSPEEGAPPVLTLTFDHQAALADDPNQAALRDVTLSFDVPQTDPTSSPFAAWQASAQALALGMDAAIVDDHGTPLSPAGFDAIGNELNQLYEALQKRDLAAGSPAARRLFS